MTTVFLGMGSNLGDRQGHIEKALDKLKALPGVTLKKRSSFMENPPLAGGPQQGFFLNIVAEFEVELTATDLLLKIQQIEKEGGRQRSVFWGPRTIDIDILFFGTEIHQTNDLKVPHPERYNRDFVIIPFLEVNPKWLDPQNGRSIRENWEQIKSEKLKGITAS